MGGGLLKWTKTVILFLANPSKKKYEKTRPSLKRTMKKHVFFFYTKKDEESRTSWTKNNRGTLK